MSHSLLEVKDLSIDFQIEDAPRVQAVSSLSFKIPKGKTLGLVGESGSGKSVTALSLMRLIPDPPGKITKGQILFDGRDILKLNEKEMRQLRGNKNIHDFSGTYDQPQSCIYHWRSNRRSFDFTSKAFQI